MLAATQLKVPTILHEQNAVMGRANRFLARRVQALAKGFDNLVIANPAIAGKATLVGNRSAPPSWRRRRCPTRASAAACCTSL